MVRMRYRITLENTGEGFEAVIYREFTERELGKPSVNDTDMLRMIFAIDIIHGKIEAELKNQSAYSIKRIEEVPTD